LLYHCNIISSHLNDIQTFAGRFCHFELFT
jgi:hypothetical protein